MSSEHPEAPKSANENCRVRQSAVGSNVKKYIFYGRKENNDETEANTKNSTRRKNIKKKKVQK